MDSLAAVPRALSSARWWINTQYYVRLAPLPRNNTWRPYLHQPLASNDVVVAVCGWTWATLVSRFSCTFSSQNGTAWLLFLWGCLFVLLIDGLVTKIFCCRVVCSNEAFWRWNGEFLYMFKTNLYFREMSEWFKNDGCLLSNRFQIASLLDIWKRWTFPLGRTFQGLHQRSRQQTLCSKSSKDCFPLCCVFWEHIPSDFCVIAIPQTFFPHHHDK